MDANEEGEIAVSCESLDGKWEAVGSEIPSFGNDDVTRQWYHFSGDQFWWEFLYRDGRKQRMRFTFRIREGGFEWKGKNSVTFETNAFHVAEFLIFRPSHGMETWMVRIGKFGEEVHPSYLT